MGKYTKKKMLLVVALLATGRGCYGHRAAFLPVATKQNLRLITVAMDTGALFLDVV